MDAFDFPPEFADEANNLAIDFDGVIHNADKGFHDGTCYGDPLPGSLDALQLLATKYRIIIFTAKAKPNRPLVKGKTGTELVSEWLEKHEVLRFFTLTITRTDLRTGKKLWNIPKGYEAFRRSV
jgi:hypothetical protein